MEYRRLNSNMEEDAISAQFLIKLSIIHKLVVNVQSWCHEYLFWIFKIASSILHYPGVPLSVFFLSKLGKEGQDVYSCVIFSEETINVDISGCYFRNEIELGHFRSGENLS